MRQAFWRALALVLGSALAVVLLWVAQPGAVLQLMAGLPLGTIAGAGVLHLGIVVTRAWRLRMLSGGRLSRRAAFLLFASSQAASALLPWRMGEMALPPLARWAIRTRISQGAFWWLAGRFFDLYSLAVAVAALALFRLLPLTLLAPASVLLVVLTGAALASTRRRVWYWGVRLLPSRRWAKGALRVRRLLAELKAKPTSLASSLALSLLSWGLIVGFTGVLCQAMRGLLTWRQVLLAVLGATLGAAVPMAGLGNLGPLEAGFASALSVTGVPTAEALALGFALHFWTLAFQLLLGIPSAALLATRVKDSLEPTALPEVYSRRNSGKGGAPCAT